ncbi:hypothetical protein D9M68_859850 [compost metagenome]
MEWVLAEQRSIIHVRGGNLHCADRAAQGHGRMPDARTQQGILCEFEAVTDLAQQVARGHANILELERRNGDAVPPELVHLRADVKAGRIPWHQHRDKARWSLLRPAHDHEPVGRRAPGDELLASIDDKLIPLSPNGGPQSAHIGAGFGFGERKRRLELARSQTR